MTAWPDLPGIIAPAGAAVVELSGVTLGFDDRTVLDGVTLAIEANCFVGVLGANGAGKTTLMRAILGLMPPRAGSVRVLGQAARQGNPAVGYMPQFRDTSAAGRLRGYDVVAAAVNGHRWGLPWLGTAGRREVDWALGMVGATAIARRPLAETSGGERQRLLLAQALIGRPRLLLLDEPLISLDPSRAQAVVTLVRDLQKALGLTVLFSAHELNPLLGALDRVLYLGSGKAALGTVDEVITGPILSRLYGSPIEVVRIGGRIFVMAGSHEVGQDAHLHEPAGPGHTHHHAHDHGGHG
jgi:zinc/manganese transport system ATP-binding protein